MTYLQALRLLNLLFPQKFRSSYMLKKNLSKNQTYKLGFFISIVGLISPYFSSCKTSSHPKAETNQVDPEPEQEPEKQNNENKNPSKTLTSSKPDASEIQPDNDHLLESDSKQKKIDPMEIKTEMTILNETSGELDFICKFYGKYPLEVTAKEKSGLVLISKITDETNYEINFHATEWELENLFNNQFKICLDYLKDKRKHSKLKFRKFFNTSNHEEPTFLVRTVLHPIQKAKMYIKIINPKKSIFFIPESDKEQINCNSLSVQNLIYYGHDNITSQEMGKLCSKTCNDLKFNSEKENFEKNFDTGEFEIKAKNPLIHAILSVDQWAQKYPGYNLYINTSWFNVKDFGPHKTPCSQIYGLNYSHGRKIQDAILDRKEDLSLFAVLKNGDIEFIENNDIKKKESEINYGFSGAHVLKHSIKLDFPAITIPYQKTGRTAFALDLDKNLIIFYAENSNVEDLVNFLQNNLNATDILIADGGGSARLIFQDDQQNLQITTPNRDVEGPRPCPSILAAAGNVKSFAKAGDGNLHQTQLDDISAKNQESLPVFIFAHADDWQLFAGDHAYPLLEENKEIVFVYLSASDNGNPENYWQVREDAAMASLKLFTKKSEKISQTTQTLHGINITYKKIRNSHSYFLRLPDGQISGVGSSRYGFESMQKLLEKKISIIHSIDKSHTPYTLELIEKILQEIVEKHRGRKSITLNTFNVNDSGHSDHLSTAFLTKNAFKNYSKRICKSVIFQDYRISNLPINISQKKSLQKKQLFEAYDNYLDSHGYEKLQDNLRYISWFNRTYAKERTCQTVE